MNSLALQPKNDRFDLFSQIGMVEGPFCAMVKGRHGDVFEKHPPGMPIESGVKYSQLPWSISFSTTQLYEGSTVISNLRNRERKIVCFWMRDLSLKLTSLVWLEVVVLS